MSDQHNTQSAGPTLSQAEIDAIFDAHRDAPTMSFRYYVTDAITKKLEEKRAAKTSQLLAWSDVLAERMRQIHVEGWTFEHDDEHDAGELAAAASAYALAAADEQHPLSQGDGGFMSVLPAMWPWAREWWKPGEPRRMLVKAAALTLAAIEQIDRHAKSGADDQEGTKCET